MAERRKTAHLTERFREFVTEKMREVTGLDLKPEQAWAIFRISYKIPMRFLFSLPDHEVNSYGDKSIPVPGIGQFKIYRAKPTDDKRVGDGEEAYYPRFKFYPASAISAEVEKFFGISDEASEKVYSRVSKAEDKMIEQTRNQIKKNMEKLSMFVESKDDSDLEKLIRQMIREEIKNMEKDLDYGDPEMEEGVSEREEDVSKMVKDSLKAFSEEEKGKDEDEAEITDFDFDADTELEEVKEPEKKKTGKSKEESNEFNLEDDFDFDFDNNK